MSFGGHSASGEMLASPSSNAVSWLALNFANHSLVIGRGVGIAARESFVRCGNDAKEIGGTPATSIKSSRRGGKKVGDDDAVGAEVTMLISDCDSDGGSGRVFKWEKPDLRCDRCVRCGGSPTSIGKSEISLRHSICKYVKLRGNIHTKRQHIPFVSMSHASLVSDRCIILGNIAFRPIAVLPDHWNGNNSMSWVSLSTHSRVHIDNACGWLISNLVNDLGR